MCQMFTHTAFANFTIYALDHAFRARWSSSRKQPAHPALPQQKVRCHKMQRCHYAHAPTFYRLGPYAAAVWWSVCNSQGLLWWVLLYTKICVAVCVQKSLSIFLFNYERTPVICAHCKQNKMMDRELRGGERWWFANNNWHMWLYERRRCAQPCCCCCCCLLPVIARIERCDSSTTGNGARRRCALHSTRTRPVCDKRNWKQRARNANTPPIRLLTKKQQQQHLNTLCPRSLVPARRQNTEVENKMVCRIYQTSRG